MPPSAAAARWGKVATVMMTPTRSSLRSSSRYSSSVPVSHESAPSEPVLAKNFRKARSVTPPTSSDEEDDGEEPLKAPRGKIRAQESTTVRMEEDGQTPSSTRKRRVRFEEEGRTPTSAHGSHLHAPALPGGDDSMASQKRAAPPDWNAAVEKMEGRQRVGVKAKMKQWASKGVASVLGNVLGKSCKVQKR
ncbi:hypothetical protein T484DRAFT_2335769 [Baffinella frigidus]|nr:hypothetical protein T484DRAFT_2335769 [Cryptophyta sp. CCMP2293]|mmetsp:Transcript_48329/g.115019  ORF Transcript_48329/g.115019 Transcript_48329/m.115019 type:complete len:191 (+) Transcript_48329:192-764(+)